jgi:hypothetical protein
MSKDIKISSAILTSVIVAIKTSLNFNHQLIMFATIRITVIWLEKKVSFQNSVRISYKNSNNNTNYKFCMIEWNKLAIGAVKQNYATKCARNVKSIIVFHVSLSK